MVGAETLRVIDRPPKPVPEAKWDFPIIQTEGGPHMKRKQFTEQQIIGILKEHEAGAAVADLARRHGVSEQSPRVRIVGTVFPLSVHEAGGVRC